MEGGRGTPDQCSKGEAQATAASARSIRGSDDRAARMVRDRAVAYIARVVGTVAGSVPRRLPRRAAANTAASVEGVATRSRAPNGIRNHDGRCWCGAPGDGQGRLISNRANDYFSISAIVKAVR